MTDPVTWQEQLDVLAHGEVQPLLLATDVERQERLGVHVVLLTPSDDVSADGHTSTMPVFSRWFELAGDLSPDEEQVRQMRRETVVDFAVRLRDLLS